MTDKLPPQLLQLFQPRPPLRYIPPQDPSPEDHASQPSKIGGVADFLPSLAEYVETDVYHPTESWLQRKDRLNMEKQARLAEMKKEDFESYKPEADPQIRGDAFKTLFVGRLSYDAKESDLEREFGRFGAIERVSSPRPSPQMHETAVARRHITLQLGRPTDLATSRFASCTMRTRKTLRKRNIEAMHLWSLSGKRT